MANELKIRVNSLLGKCDCNYTSEEFNGMPKSGTFFFCTIREARYLLERQFGVVSFSETGYDVSSWMPMIGDLALNWKDSYYLHAGQLSGDETGMFCRSDSAYKEWSGQVARNAIDIDTIKMSVPSDEMMFVAPKASISCEWRCWMINDRCVAWSRYGNPFCEYAPGDPDDAKAIGFAETVAREVYGPDEAYVVDIALSHGRYKVVEYNCYSTSGFYDVDREMLFDATRRHFGGR